MGELEGGWTAQAIVCGVTACGVLAVGCSPLATPGSGYCAPPVSSRWSVPEDVPSLDADRTERLAAILGLRAELLARRSPGGERSTEAQVRGLARIEAVRVALDATGAELSCESERADQAADYLERRQSQTVQALTVSSILASTATSVAGVLLSTSGASATSQDLVAIGGGAVTAGLGLGSIWVHPTIRFQHARNLLADIWTGPRYSTAYPAPVWAYLMRGEFSNDRTRPIREQIVARWRSLQTIDGSASTLLFGAGGSYDVETLRARSAMLDQVRAEVDLENQEIALLASELLR